MESLSAGYHRWQVLRACGRQAGKGSPTLAGQNVDEWGGVYVDVIVDIIATFDLPQSTLLRH
jgi:hypothetical protein